MMPIGGLSLSEIHLADVVVLNIVDLQIDQREAAQNAVIKHQVHPKCVLLIVIRYCVFVFPHGDAGLLLVEAALERVVDLQKLNNDRPA